MVIRPLAVVLALLIVSPAPTRAQDNDSAAIRTLESHQAAAWNAHDASAYAALFTPEGDVVNVLGWWWQGRAEIQRKLTDAFATVFRKSHLTITDVAVRKLSPDIAVAHVRWTMKGALAPAGGAAPPQQGIQLQILVRTRNGWRISSFQNTNSIPERPFPRARAATQYKRS
ncbi:MAG TPA: SgcJ/EcaC family oxidoreductase [Steroidobacteraceae bacterium]|nr:SgcJ/EcaC family oxidoreductase [Steroidobacteraceae bacterium]